MNVLIADDEYLVRASLKSMLIELNMGINIVGEASNSDEFMRIIFKCHPDLVYIDIKMPEINGLELIKAVKNQCPNTEWIILTGFSTFEYAKEALDLGVEKYLLKPVSPDELKNSVEIVLRKKTEQQQELNFEFGHDITALFNNFITLDDLQKSNDIFYFHFMGAILSFDSYLSKSENEKILQKFWCSISNLKKDFIDPSIRIAFIAIPDGNFAAVFAWNPADNSAGKIKAELFFKQIINVAKRMNTCDYCETVLYCDECGSFKQLNDQLLKIRELAHLKKLMPYGEPVSLDRLINKYETSSPQELKLIEMTTDIIKKYKSGSYYEYIKAVEQIGYYLSSNSLGADAIKPFYRSLQCCCPKTDLNPKSNLSSIIEILKESGQTKLNANSKTGDLVDQTISFINDNYMKDIGIAQIASRLDVTPNYLSMLFHKKTGENFVHYLTKTRLLKARELLTSSDNPRINLIAKQVGYYTVSYFTKLYKEYYGVCPSEDVSH
jgi:two-component system, response regulator YesN